jgi:transposase
MEAIRTHIAGIDVHKEMLAITVLRGTADQKPEVIQFECKTFSEDLIACAQKLLELGVKDVAMESTGIYWKPIHNIFSPMGIRITLGQAAHVKNVPGRKTDMNDSHWLAELHRFGLIRPSFIPEDEFQRMRLLSRHRTNLTADLGRIKNRVQKTLEDGNIKWGSIVSNVFGKSGLAILRLLADGVTDANILSSAVRTKIKRREEARKSLTNCFTGEHCFLIRELMDQYDHLQAKILRTDNELFEKAKPYAHLVAELKKIPGIDDVLAMGILAEATNDMSHFEDERKFAAWSGVAAGNNESAGKKKDQDAVKATRIFGES